MINTFSNLKEIFLKYTFYFFPLLIILGNALVNFFFILVLFLYFVSCIIEKKVIFFEQYEFKYFFLFYIYLLINSLIAEDLLASLLRSIPYLKYFIFVLVFKDLIEKEKISLKKIGYSWFFIIFILSLDIIYQSINGHNIFNFVSKQATRNSGFFFDELVAGGFLVSFVSICTFLILKKNRDLLICLFFLFFLIIIFLTGERSNLIDFIIISILVYIFCIKKNFILKFFSFLSFILILLFMITNLDNFKDRYFSSISFSNNKNLNLFQIYLTSEYGSHSISSFLIFRDNFLLGVGNKNFRTACKNYKNEVVQFQKEIDKTDRDLYPNGCGTHPHQIYNEFLSEHGILGSFIILFLISRLILKNFRVNNNSNLNLVCFFYLILYFIPILPSGSFFSTLPSTFFWINYLFYIVNVRKYV